MFLQPISKELFFRKYALHGEKSVEEVLNNVAKKISSNEKNKYKKFYEKEFYNILINNKFIPGGRILANARLDSKIKNYSNCFVIDIEDDLDKIYDSVKEGALISKQGGGFGFNISKIRPKNDNLSVGGVASGPISFMKVFDQSAKIIMTGGQRRAAILVCLNVDHPDIEEFITCKRGDENKALTQMNISVGITDKFIKAVEYDEDWNLQFNGKIYKTIKAKYLYDLICKNAFDHNEPGILNLDTINRFNNGWYIENFEATNPCGELPLFKYEACNLGSLNLTKFIKNSFSKTVYFDFEDFKKTIQLGVRFLDNVIDLTELNLEKFNKSIKKYRRIGLGFTGLGNCFSMLNMKYGDRESKYFSEELARTLRDTSYLSSILLAKEKGKFPAYSKKILESNFISDLPINIFNKLKKYGIRNISINTTAPTGTTSLTLGQNCSSGIEPVISLEYNRKIRTGNSEETKTEKVYDYAYLLYKDYCEANNIEDITNENFVTISDISTFNSIDIQSIFQKYIDGSISKTLNLPKGTKFDEYKKLFLYAYKKGLKGFTTYNPEGSMKGILDYNNQKDKDNITIERHDAPKRPESLNCDIHQVKVKDETFTILVGMLDDGSIYEIFADNNHVDIQKYKTGVIKKLGKKSYNLICNDEIVIENISKEFNKIYGTLTRLVSANLRHGMPLECIIDTLSKSDEFISFDKAISRVLKKYIKNGEKVNISTVCPNCGSSNLIYIEGCKSCIDCGMSMCS